MQNEETERLPSNSKTQMNAAVTYQSDLAEPSRTLFRYFENFWEPSGTSIFLEI